ncbi:hypothetical protein [Roseobacter sp. S98]|uniref:hypothetical protein n=1 Tax=Roseobacter algicola (ex Choi et al. 2025) (nom. illeg.) TaxID=3092138 RepID=UPI0035C741C9
MSQSILERLRAANEFRDTPEAAIAGDVHVRILSVDRAELSLLETRCEIGIERGSDENGRPGWYIYPEDTTQWDDGRTINSEEHAEISRLLTAALVAKGYQVWTD